jgi:hypothetical protein
MSLFFYVGNSKSLSIRTGLLLPHMLELDFMFFPNSMFVVFLLFFFQQKKEMGRRCRYFIFLSIAFQISYVFLFYISAHCALIEFAYI